MWHIQLERVAIWVVVALPLADLDGQDGDGSRSE